jgi:hypothetical protein
MERVKFTEERFNAIIAACQWSSDWFIAVAFLVTLFGVRPPSALVDGFIWTISAAAPLFLTVGMYQCWRLPDWRRYLAIPASVFLIVSAVLMFGAAVQNNRADEYQKALVIVRASAAWKTANAEYEAVLADYNTLAAREFTQEFATQFDKNEKAKDAKWAKVQEKAKVVSDLEPEAVKPAGSPFDIAGPSLAWLVCSIFLALYSIVNNAVAMALSHRGKEKPRKSKEQTEEKKANPADHTPTIDEYIDVAKRIGTNGRLAGAEAVSKETGWKLHVTKAIVRKAIEAGRMRVPPGSNRPEEAKV